MVFLILVFIFKWIDNKSIIDVILKVAGYTYGPLLGLFSFAILTKRVLPDNFRIILVCLIAPILVFIIDLNSKTWFGGFSFGYLNLGLNGLITFIGLLLISKSKA